VSADPQAAVTTLTALKQIREELGCHTSLGVSNVSFGLPCREVLNSTFFLMALESGLSAAIMNPHAGDMMKVYHAYKALTNQDENCADYIAAAATFATTVNTAVAAATTENIDFLVLLGDLVSMVETEADCQIANELAFGITGGQIPVIYARGNHEIKGEYGELLYKYVGSKNQEFYYYVTLGSEVFAVVADIGEDHDDAWWEYYGTARFQQYRDVQTAYYEELLDSGIWKEYDYRMAISHIPFSYVGSKGYFEADCNRWTEIFNEMGMDMGLSGHKHVMWALLPEHTPESSPMPYSVAFKGAEGKTDKGYITDIAFPCFLVGRRSDSFTGGTQGDGYDQYSCLFTHADLTAGEQVSRYINARGQTLEGAYPFYEETYSQVKTQLRS
jgi:hypothetical protein